MKYLLSALVVSAAFTAVPSQAQAILTGADLVRALRGGGYVIVMRHATSPTTTPTRQEADATNVKLERQLDEAGRQGAIHMGEAVKRLRIPIGNVLTSPTYRARETARLAGFANAKPYDELGDHGQSMQNVEDAQAAWLRTRSGESPPKGTNTLIVTHLPNISKAFPDWGPGVADGECVILKPTRDQPFDVVGRIRIEEWPHLAQPR